MKETSLHLFNFFLCVRMRLWDLSPFQRRVGTKHPGKYNKTEDCIRELSLQREKTVLAQQ